jgi:hypothetical protein
MRAAIKIGKRFGHWVVLAKLLNHRYPAGQTAALWLCRCDCGSERPVLANSLRRGASTNCGCVQREQLGARCLIHGHSKKGQYSRAYRSWAGMLQRCGNPRRKEFPHYGGRGITVCDRWLIFTNFLLDMSERPSGTSIDRVNPDGNYEPGNCRWAAPAQQVANRRPYRRPKLCGERGPGAKLSVAHVEQIRALSGHLSQKQIAEKFGVSKSNVWHIVTGKTWAHTDAAE